MSVTGSRVGMLFVPTRKRAQFPVTGGGQNKLRFAHPTVIALGTAAIR